MPGPPGEVEFVDSFLGKGTTGVAVDVGSCDGSFISNVEHLDVRGWQVLYIEPNPAWGLVNNKRLVLTVACGPEPLDNQEFVVLEREGVAWASTSALKPDPRFLALYEAASRKSVIRVNVRTLDWCCEQIGFDHVDFLNIDVEGYDLEVLKGFDIRRWKPKLLVLEDLYDDQGIDEYLAPYGFERRLRTGSYNNYYTPKDVL